MKFRARQSNEPGGRRVRHEVLLTAEQKLALQSRAQDRGVTVSRLMVESALSDHQGFASRQDLVTLFEMKNLLGATSRNINQIAKVANATGQVPDDFGHTLELMRRVTLRMDDVSRAITGRAVKERDL